LARVAFRSCSSRCSSQSGGGETERFRNENEPDEVMGVLDTLGITALHLRHPDYPSQLTETPAAPSVIYMKGEMLTADEPAIAVVGSRDATPYGLEMTRRISYDLARAGVTVVSGLVAVLTPQRTGPPSKPVVAQWRFLVQGSTACIPSTIFRWPKKLSKTVRYLLNIPPE
jgi:hypothetical protein